MKLTGAPATTPSPITAAAEADAVARGGTAKPDFGLLGFACLLLMAQIVALFAIVDRDIELGTYVGAHLFCCVVLMCYLAWPLVTVCDRDLTALQIVGWSAIGGPFGTLVAMALTLRVGVIASPQTAPDASTDPSTDDHSIVGSFARMHSVLLDRRVRLQGAGRVRPLIDVVVEGSQAEKLEALSISYWKYEGKLSVLLKRALQDCDTSVRVLAATVIAKLHAKYGRKIGDCQDMVASKPHVGENWRQLAESRLAYAESSLLEGTRARAQLESAIGELMRAVELDPADAACAACLSRARRLLTHGGRG